MVSSGDCKRFLTTPLTLDLGALTALTRLQLYGYPEYHEPGARHVTHMHGHAWYAVPWKL